MSTLERARVLLLIDKRGWAFDTLALAIQKHLGNEFHFTIAATDEKPVINDADYHIIHTFFDREQYHLPFVGGRVRIIKSVYSLYWNLEGMSPQELYLRFHREAHAMIVPNFKLLSLLSGLPVPVHLCPEGVDTDFFHPEYYALQGPLRVGWAGNPQRYIKRFSLLKDAAHGIGDLLAADGDKTPDEMLVFYNSVDVIACASYAEGTPRPLLEGMACGAFPVSFDVGIVPEVVTHAVNGLVVHDETVQGMHNALQWCNEHIEHVRGVRSLNVERIRALRSWQATLPALARVYRSVL